MRHLWSGINSNQHLKREGGGEEMGSNKYICYQRNQTLQTKQIMKEITKVKRIVYEQGARVSFLTPAV